MSRSHCNGANSSMNGSQGLCGVYVDNLPDINPSQAKETLKDLMKEYGRVMTVNIEDDGLNRAALVLFHGMNQPQQLIPESGQAAPLSINGTVCHVTPAPTQAVQKAHEQWLTMNSARASALPSPPGRRPQFRNGHSIEGIVDVFADSASRVMYIGKLDKGTTEAQLRQRFRRFGEILEVDVKNKDSPAPFAFIQFDSIQSVVDAINFHVEHNNMANTNTRGRRFLPNFGRTPLNSKLWIGNLPEAEEEYIKRKLRETCSLPTEVCLDPWRREAIMNFYKPEHAKQMLDFYRRRPLSMMQKEIWLVVDFAAENLYSHFVQRRSTQASTAEKAKNAAMEKAAKEKADRARIHYGGGSNVSTPGSAHRQPRQFEFRDLESPSGYRRDSATPTIGRREERKTLSGAASRASSQSHSPASVDENRRSTFETNGSRRYGKPLARTPSRDPIEQKVKSEPPDNGFEPGSSMRVDERVKKEEEPEEESKDFVDTWRPQEPKAIYTPNTGAIIKKAVDFERKFEEGEMAAEDGDSSCGSVDTPNDTVSNGRSQDSPAVSDISPDEAIHDPKTSPEGPSSVKEDTQSNRTTPADFDRFSLGDADSVSGVSSDGELSRIEAFRGRVKGRQEAGLRVDFDSPRCKRVREEARGPSPLLFHPPPRPPLTNGRDSHTSYSRGAPLKIQIPSTSANSTPHSSSSHASNSPSVSSTRPFAPCISRPSSLLTRTPSTSTPPIGGPRVIAIPPADFSVPPPPFTPFSSHGYSDLGTPTSTGSRDPRRRESSSSTAGTPLPSTPTSSLRSPPLSGGGVNAWKGGILSPSGTPVSTKPRSSIDSKSLTPLSAVQARPVKPSERPFASRTDSFSSGVKPVTPSTPKTPHPLSFPRSSSLSEKKIAPPIRDTANEMFDKILNNKGPTIDIRKMQKIPKKDAKELPKKEEKPMEKKEEEKKKTKKHREETKEERAKRKELKRKNKEKEREKEREERKYDKVKQRKISEGDKKAKRKKKHRSEESDSGSASEDDYKSSFARQQLSQLESDALLAQSLASSMYDRVKGRRSSAINKDENKKKEALHLIREKTAKKTKKRVRLESSDDSDGTMKSGKSAAKKRKEGSDESSGEEEGKKREKKREDDESEFSSDDSNYERSELKAKAKAKKNKKVKTMDTSDLFAADSNDEDDRMSQMTDTSSVSKKSKKTKEVKAKKSKEETEKEKKASKKEKVAAKRSTDSEKGVTAPAKKAKEKERRPSESSSDDDERSSKRSSVSASSWRRGKRASESSQAHSEKESRKDGSEDIRSPHRDKEHEAKPFMTKAAMKAYASPLAVSSPPSRLGEVEEGEEEGTPAPAPLPPTVDHSSDSSESSSDSDEDAKELERKLAEVDEEEKEEEEKEEDEEKEEEKEENIGKEKEEEKEEEKEVEKEEEKEEEGEVVDEGPSHFDEETENAVRALQSHHAEDTTIGSLFEDDEEPEYQQAEFPSGFLDHTWNGHHDTSHRTPSPASELCIRPVHNAAFLPPAVTTTPLPSNYSAATAKYTFGNAFPTTSTTTSTGVSSAPSLSTSSPTLSAPSTSTATVTTTSSVGVVSTASLASPQSSSTPPSWTTPSTICTVSRVGASPMASPLSTVSGASPHPWIQRPVGVATAMLSPPPVATNGESAKSLENGSHDLSSVHGDSSSPPSSQALEKKWEGRLCMRAKAVQTMWFLVGSRLPPSTPSVDQFIGQIFHPSTDPEVRISQKMRLDEKSTTDLTTKMEEGRCLSLIVVPCGETPEIVRHNQEHFHKTFIEYFSNKHVAGIAEITGVDQRVYLVHLLTPGPITTQYLPESIVSNLSKRGSDYLLAVIVAKDSINP